MPGTPIFVQECSDIGITDTRAQLIQKIAYKSVFFEFEFCAVFLESGLDLRRT